MSGEKYITLAIHTSERAGALKRILESHGIEVRLEKIMISSAGIAYGIRVKIEEHDLPLALKITESNQCYLSEDEGLKLDGKEGNVLIPVDFSPNSILACKVGFDLARRLNLHPVIIHAYATPYFYGPVDPDSTFNGDFGMEVPEEMAAMEAGIDMKKESDKMMRTLRKKLTAAQEEGSLPDIKFSTILRDGIPEDIIKEYCSQTPPVVVVMATRGKDKRDEALIGSVTAEVIDSSRVPVFVVPENCQMTSVEAVTKLVYLCNMDRQDILSVDTLMRMFGYPEVEVTLVPVNEKGIGNVKERIDMLRDYFNKSYPTAHFSAKVFPEKTFREDFENYVSGNGIEMLIVPNKKRNIFQRLFNPGIAHKLLFERDMPMLALPV